MGISSIVQIANRLLNGDSGQDSQGQGKSKITPAAAQARSNRTEFGDRFTPSSPGEVANSGGGTGFFQVEQLRFTAVNIQMAAGNATGTTAASPAVTLNSAAVAPAAAAPPPEIASAIQAQQDLQALNASPVALGLNAAEIAAFDQFAGVLLQFDPNALQDLQNQLNLLATRFQTQNAAPASATPSPATTPNFQLTELSVSFTGLNETLTQGNQVNGGGTTTQFSAFSLQIKEVQITLSNPAEETARLKIPHANTAISATAATSTKAASA